MASYTSALSESRSRSLTGLGPAMTRESTRSGKRQVNLRATGLLVACGEKRCTL